MSESGSHHQLTPAIDRPLSVAEIHAAAAREAEERAKANSQVINVTSDQGETVALDFGTPPVAALERRIILPDGKAIDARVFANFISVDHSDPAQSYRVGVYGTDDDTASGYLAVLHSVEPDGVWKAQGNPLSMNPGASARFGKEGKAISLTRSARNPSEFRLESFSPDKHKVIARVGKTGNPRHNNVYKA